MLKLKLSLDGLVGGKKNRYEANKLAAQHIIRLYKETHICSAYATFYLQRNNVLYNVVALINKQH